MRLNKYLAHSGVCSRREADLLIGQGRVLVNGQPALAGQSVDETDEVTVSGKIVRNNKKTVVLAYNKPLGVTCTEKDPHADKKVTDMIRYPVRVTYAGRLDKDSEGLLLLSNDGDLIQAMTRGSNHQEKEYEVRVDRAISKGFLNKMTCGIYLEDLDVTTRPCKIEQTGKYTFKIVLTQGLNRQVRRMCEACGYRVRNLRRIRVMHIELGSLKTGEYVELSDEDVERLYRDSGLGTGAK
ncbi:MAG: rRNA pseudouridine synthase [Eubacterium sp.]|nr:rRNA pseudouridine synthase [Eubacterium sp.]MCM1217845.1 rRNA pseudouridine synthase [Lachnospiraceae bacterium]MCM1304655.1 rRNA pseudouridine synthase [Butyrivibrio sp.]MCM1344477.1 rRNA pseudouridine synthase [Muribaculaceae bacterium]MCM1240924.1 rRNA pseudouridine synthase [Lachnospiraceae bacterium]